jgi:predicted ATPase
VIKRWQDEKDPRVGEIGRALEALGLTWKVATVDIDGATVDIQIGRLPKDTTDSNKDLVSIADVGFGVSQVMPVVVALFAAEPGQAVYIEQPEIHLHPKAQVALAGLLVDAANRDVQVIVETHSALLLTSLQTQIARKRIAASEVKLHWVSRDTTGSSIVSTAELDADGAYGDWPVDFDETADAATSEYLHATVFKDP